MSDDFKPPVCGEDDCRALNRDELLDMIGRMNLLAISGGRSEPIPAGVRLPVNDEYAVEVYLDCGWDAFEVRRTRTVNGVREVLGEETQVFFDTVGDSAYRASSFVNVPFGA